MELLKFIWCKPWRFTFSQFRSSLLSVGCVCVSVLLSSRLPASPHILLFGGHVAGSRSVCELCEKGDVTSGFLCEDGQVHWCYYEEEGG